MKLWIFVKLAAALAVFGACVLTVALVVIVFSALTGLFVAAYLMR
jgi:hypothetical protein